MYAENLHQVVCKPVKYHMINKTNNKRVKIYFSNKSESYHKINTRP